MMALTGPTNHRMHFLELRISPVVIVVIIAAAMAALWSQLFGTFRYQPSGNAPRRMRLFASSRSADPRVSGFFAQLRSVFSPACCAA